MKREIRALLPVMLLLLLFAGTKSAYAHAVLVGSSPQNGERRSTAPTQVVLQFNEPVEAEFTPLVVRNRAGARVDAGDGRVDPSDHSMVQATLGPLGEDLYTAFYRITSMDGHPVEGAILFAVGNVPLTAPAEPEVVTIAPAVGASHGAVQVVAALVAGVAAFLLLVWPLHEPLPPLARWTRFLTSLLVLLVLAEVGIYAVRASGETLSARLFVRTLSHTRVGFLALLRVALAVLAGGAIGLVPRLRASLWRMLLLLPGASLLLSLSLQSHAMASGRLVPVLFDWLHLLAAALWSGGLFVLAVVGWPLLKGAATRERLPLLTVVVPRFSTVAILAVSLLAVTGLYAALLHIPSWPALFTTGHGQLLLTKLTLLSIVLLLGGYHFLRAGKGAFRTTAVVEFCLMLCIFGVTGFLTSHPPAAVEMLVRQGPFEQTSEREGLRMALRIEPARVGLNQATLTLTRADGAPESRAGAILKVRMTTHDMGVQEADLKEQAQGVYRSEPFSLTMDGEWAVEVVLLTGQGREIRQSFSLSVPPLLPR